ncbi:MAG TPA: translation factor GTPase family protein [Glycomyces sp.]|nr:translation factor GTPase family protein [Glycomyces sp.]
MHYLNLGILAHVDAGKTSLTERLLFDAGIIDRAGSVDEGSTQTDSMELERRRGITIQSAVVAFAIGDLTVNLIDTPGHTDFIAEVERALRVLDGAVLVVSAVEGVQSQTRVLMRTLKRLGVPTILFVNKVDRVGARQDELLREIAETLTPRIVPMGAVRGIGTAGAEVVPHEFAAAEHFERAAEVLAAGSDRFLAAYLDEPDPRTALDCEAELAAQSRRGAAHPVYFGSAATGAGVAALTEGIRRYLPAPVPEPSGRARGTVFKVEHGERGRRLAYLRVRGGTLRPRDRVTTYRRSAEGELETGRGKVTGVEVFTGGTATANGAAPPGGIAKVTGLRDIRVGDAIGSPDELPEGGLFTPPTLETVIRPIDPSERIRLRKALVSLAERDPLVDPHLDDLAGHMAVRLYGEVQKEVVASLLAEEFGLAVEFERSRAIHIERVVRPVEALHELGPWAPTSRPVTVGLRLEPGEPGSGLRYELEVERGSLTRALHNGVEETVHEMFRRGPYGWAVTDCRVALRAAGYLGVASAADFREVTKLLLAQMLRDAGTWVFEPVHRFDLEFPAGSSSVVLQLLRDAGADIAGQFGTATTGYLSGTMATEAVVGFETRLPSVTRGRAVFTAQHDHYRPVRGTPPRRR